MFTGSRTSSELDPRPLWAGLLLVLVADLLVGAFVARTILDYQSLPFDWDEAMHANGGLILALDLRAGDLPAFIRDSYAQAFYPPAFSWLLTPALSVFGPSRVAARMTSLICLELAVVVIYLVGLELDRRRGWIIGLAGALLTLVSLPMLTNAALVMLEIPALLASFFTLWVYLRTGGQRRWSLLAVGVLAGLTFLTKYPYGILVILTLIIVEAVGHITRNGWPAACRSLPAGRWAYLFGPLLVIGIIWFAGPGKIAGYLEYTRLQIPQDWRFGVSDLLFYPQAIALSYSPSLWVAGLLMAGLVSALAHAREEPLRLLLVYFSAGVGLLLVKGQHHNIRFVAPMVPALYLIAGRELIRYLEKRLPALASGLPIKSIGVREGARGKSRRLLPLLLFTFTLIVALAILSGITGAYYRLSLYPVLMRLEYETDPAADELATWLAAMIPPGERRLVMVNNWDQFSGPALEWAFIALQPDPPGRFQDQSVLVLWPQSSSVEAVQATQAAWKAAGVRYVVVFEGSPEGCAPCWQGHYDQLRPQLESLAETRLTLHAWDRDLIGRLRLAQLRPGAGLDAALAAAYHEQAITARVYRYHP